jgi:hypothetical protein
MKAELNPPQEVPEFTVSEPILVTEENKAELAELVLPLFKQFVPETEIRTIDGSFIKRPGNAYLTLAKNSGGEVVGASAFRIDEPGVTDEEGRSVKVLYRSSTVMSPEVRGRGLYNIVQRKVDDTARAEGAGYQVLRTQNGRVWEMAYKSFPKGSTWPSPENAGDIPSVVLGVAQAYNVKKDADG